MSEHEQCPDCGGEMRVLGRVAILISEEKGYRAQCFAEGCHWSFDHPDDIDACRIEGRTHLYEEHADG